MPKYVSFRIEVSLAKKGAAPVWHYLMEDDYSPCEYNAEADARAVITEEDRGDDIRLVGFSESGVARVVK